jgi:predicted nucleic acid-binding protein
LTLVDTSAWIHQIRPKGDAAVRARVEALLQAGEPELPIDADIWLAAHDLASRARRAGRPIPASDVLIFACARRHGVALEHADGHFDMLEGITADADSAIFAIVDMLFSSSGSRSPAAARTRRHSIA